MNTTYNRGFIALFFTLGVSSILLAYVALASAGVFDFVHARESFKTTRAVTEHTIQCADTYIDMYIRSYRTQSMDTTCPVKNIFVTHQGTDISELLFDIDHAHVKVTILHGLISDIRSFYISL